MSSTIKVKKSNTIVLKPKNQVKIMYKTVLRIHLILMRIRILDPHWEKMDPDPDSGHFYKIYWIILTKNNFQIFCFISFEIFYPKTWWTIQKWENFYNLSFFKSSDLGFRSKKGFFLQFLVDILPPGSGSVDPHIFEDADPDPGSQNPADPTDPDLDPDP